MVSKTAQRQKGPYHSSRGLVQGRNERAYARLSRLAKRASSDQGQIANTREDGFIYMTPCPYKRGDRVTCIDGPVKGQICIVKSSRYNGFSGYWILRLVYVNKDEVEVELSLREKDVCKVL